MVALVHLALVAALSVPCGSPISVDGQIAADEWGDASATNVGVGTKLLTKVAGPDLLLAIKLPARSFRYVDLYVQESSGRLINLHASMKQGERALSDGWSDQSPAFTWSPQGWNSSTAQRTGAATEVPIEHQLKPLDGYELRVPLSKLGTPARLRLEVRDFEGTKADWVWPSSSTRHDYNGWTEVKSWPACR